MNRYGILPGNVITSIIARTIIILGCLQLMMPSLGGSTLHYVGIELSIGIFYGVYSPVFEAPSIAVAGLGA